MARTARAGEVAGTASREAKRKPALRGIRGEAVTPPTELDRLIHERVRLGIVSALAVNDALTFNELKAALELTDGNLSVHARKLEEAGYVDCTKSFEGRTPRTVFSLTDSGRRALKRYVEHMESLIRAVR